MHGTCPGAACGEQQRTEELRARPGGWVVVSEMGTGDRRGSRVWFATSLNCWRHIQVGTDEETVGYSSRCWEKRLKERHNGCDRGGGGHNLF